MGIASMNFGVALDMLLAGRRLARRSWPEDTFVVYQKGYPGGIAINANTAEATGIPQGTVCVFQPYLMHRTADGSFVPWTPSQSDVLANDWFMLSVAEERRVQEGMSYSDAARLILDKGFRLSRKAWGDSEVYVYVTGVDSIKRNEDNRRSAYKPTETDRRATDWFVASYTREKEGGA